MKRSASPEGRKLGRMKVSLTCLALLAMLCVFMGSSRHAMAGPPGSGDRGYSQTAGEKARSVELIKARSTQRGSRARVIVGLDEGFIPAGQLASRQRGQQRDKIDAAQRKLLSRMSNGKFRERRRFREIPFLVMDVDESQLDMLSSLPEVTSIEEDVLSRPSLASSNAILGSPAAWSAGYDGRGFAVAVLDTGVDGSHPYFAATGKVLEEACFSSNVPGQGGTSTCPGGVEVSMAVGSARPCSTADCDHGTHLAGIAVGNPPSGTNFGVARGAELIAVQIYTDFDNVGYCGNSQPCSLSYASDQIAAMEYIYSLSDIYNIAAVNLSLGAGAYDGYCDVSEVGRKAAIDNLRSVGIATIAASGNDGQLNQLQSPACISSAISVGASTGADTVASFSNVADNLSLLAPGISVTSSVPGGGTNTQSGTSGATPHVAGAWAVLRQKYPGASVDGILQLLQETGVAVDLSSRGGPALPLRRIDVAAALGIDAPTAPDVMAGAYVPTFGCRLVDTRSARTAIAPLVEYEFMAGKIGQNLAVQGGNDQGCAIPDDAIAIQVNISVISYGSAGFLRSWPAGKVEPNATSLVWDGDASNSFVLPLCTGGACPADFSIKAYINGGAVDVVVDMFGYFSN